MKSQVRSFRSPEHLKAIAKLRGGQSNCEYAESFQILKLHQDAKYFQSVGIHVLPKNLLQAILLYHSQLKCSAADKCKNLSLCDTSTKFGMDIVLDVLFKKSHVAT